MNKLWFEQSLSDAVDKPRLHTQLVPDQDVSYEKIPFDSSGKYRMSRREMRERAETSQMTKSMRHQ